MGLGCPMQLGVSHTASYLAHPIHHPLIGQAHTLQKPLAFSVRRSLMA